MIAGLRIDQLTLSGVYVELALVKYQLSWALKDEKILRSRDGFEDTLSRGVLQ